MAKVELDTLIRGLSGKIGDFVFRQMPDGSTVISKLPTKKHKSTKAQKRTQRRLTASSAYASQAAKQYPIYAEIAATNPSWTAYNVAVSDWHHPPVIHHVEREENRILVQATDNVTVTDVQITILDEKGTVMEQGAATRTHGDWWEYISNAQGKTIIAEAQDLPKNTTRFILESTLHPRP